MVFEQKFGFSVVVFCSHAAISLWILLCFLFFGSDFFLDGFLNPFTAHFRPSFLFELNFHLSLVVFLFSCGILTLFFCFFFYFLVWFFKNGFLNSLIVQSRSSCFLVNENSLNCTSGLVLLCFFTLSNFFFALPHFAAFSTFRVKFFWLL